MSSSSKVAYSKENYIVQKYAQIYNAQEGTDLTSVTATNVLKYYQDNARASYSSYVVAEDTAGYESAILGHKVFKHLHAV